MNSRQFLSLVKTPKKTANGWQAKCPGHDDRRASLSIAEGDKGIVLKCQAGCETKAIVAALDLKLSDLFTASPKTHSDRENAKNGAQKRRIVATYPYTDEQEHLLFEAVRYEPKGFGQRRPDGKGGWHYNLEGARRVLYRLPELIKAVKKGETVFVVEGEKDVDALCALGLVATCNPMGAGKWRDEYNEPLRGAHVVILPDNDKAGRDHAEAVAAALAGIAASVKILVLPGLPDKGDVSDWLAQGGDVATLRALAANTSGNGADEWEPPIPFYRFDLPVFPTDALPDWWRVFVEGLAEATQTPEDLAAMMSLSTVSACVARNVEIESHWREPLNLFTVTALPPANRKSYVTTTTVKPLSEYEAALIADQRNKIVEAQSERRMDEERLARWEKECARLEGDQLDEKKQAAKALARELAARPIAAWPQIFGSDITAEELSTKLCEQDGRFALFSAEGGLFETMAGRYSNGTANIDVYLKAHAGDDLRVNRRNRAEFIDRPALTLGLAVQPEVVRGMVKPGFRGLGLLGRFLYSMPLSTLGRRKIKPQPLNEEAQRTYRKNIMRLAAIEPHVDADGKTSPHVLKLSPDAEDYFVKFQEDLEPQLADGGELELMRDWAGKLAGAVLRIAGLLHLAQNVHQLTPLPLEVSASVMKDAITTGEYLIPHAKAAYAEMGADDRIEAARYVLHWIEKAGVTEFTKRDIWQGARRRFKEVAELDGIFAILEDHGYIKMQRSDVDSRPGRKASPKFFINPYLCTHNPHNPHNSTS